MTMGPYGGPGNPGQPGYPAGPGYPGFPGAPGVPADSTGVYPALTGYTPMDTGRRIAVVVADVAIALVVVGIAMGITLALQKSVGPLVGLAIELVLLAAMLWALFARASRLAGVFLRATYVDVHTGRPAGGKLFVKQLLTSVIGGVSLGIAPLVVWFASVQEPLKRNWFDRTTGLMLVDWRTGRRPGDPVPQAVSEPPRESPSGVSSVQFPAAPEGWEPGPAAQPSWGLPAQAAASGPGEQPSWQPGPSQDAASAPWSPPASTPPAPQAIPDPFDWPAVTPAAHPGVNPIVAADGLITSTPGSVARPTVPVAAAAEPRPQVVVREMRSVDAAAEHTMLAGDADLEALAGGGGVFLDDTTPLRLDPPTVIGRNPQAPGSHPDAVPHPVTDPRASKTHLLVGRDDKGPWVIDLHSTNGVALLPPGGEAVRIAAGRKVHLVPGAVALFGEHRIVAR